MAWALAAFGGGSMLAALAMPRLLERVPDRPAMLAGGTLLVAGTVLGPVAAGNLGTLLGLWAVLGLGYSLAQTPTGRLLRRSSQPDDRPAVFAAQFARSHACWLVTYPLAGRVGAAIGLPATFLVMAGVGVPGLLAAVLVWPGRDETAVAHTHPDLPPDHPHLRAHGEHQHSHPLAMDDLHRRWPREPGRSVS